MNDIFDFDHIFVDADLMERVNPVFNTAKMTLFQLSMTGDGNAKAIADKLGLTYESAQNSKSTKVPEEILLLNTIIFETRYRTIASIAKKSGYPTLVDLPCGYTPRAIEFVSQDVRYVGIDLPAAISGAGPAITSLIDEDKRDLVRFVGADATNYASLEKALEGIDGELCITTEGLLMYFNQSEVDAFCSNIARILSEHGGCWLLADPEVSMQFIVTAKVLFGECFMEAMAKMKAVSEEKSDVGIQGNSLLLSAKEGASGIQKVMDFLAAHGLKGERMVVSEHMPELSSFSNLEMKQVEAIKAAMGQCAYWKITLAKDPVKVDASMVKSHSFDAEAVYDNRTLTLCMAGRLDSINAPTVLAFWEKVSKERNIVMVNLDCAKLDYISSAGLRVLLMMYKGCPEGVRVVHASGLVKEILIQAGFDSFIQLVE